MDELRRLKPYKTTPPMETVHRIRRILLDDQIFVIEASQKRDPVTGVCSCRIILGDEEYRGLDIGYNGKGMDAQYALASAYAEFMERLQCGATLWRATGTRRWTPGAFPAEREELRAMALSLLRLSFGDREGLAELAERYAAGAGDAGAICFTSYTTGERLTFPAELYNQMMGSNGMASGNTTLEAILHGLSEIFERAALKRIYLRPATPPTIDRALFKGCDVLDRLDRLESRGIRYSILDCSAGMGLPVIGLLLKKDGKYHMHLGSDPSPVTALERCLTETFQGKDLEKIPFSPPMPASADQKRLAANGKKAFKNGGGQVPAWVVDGTPSWPFAGFPHPVSRSDEEDMAYYLQILKDLGKDLYVMNCSFLGFPTVRLFVPGLSHIHRLEPEDCADTGSPWPVRSALRRLPLLTDDEYRDLALRMRAWLEDGPGIRGPEDYCGEGILDLSAAFPAGEFPVRTWDERLLIAAIYLRGGLTREGDAYLEKVIGEAEGSDAFARVLRVRLHSPTLTFLPSLWPECPDCASCRARGRCRQDAVDVLQSRLMESMQGPPLCG